MADALLWNMDANVAGWFDGASTNDAASDGGAELTTAVTGETIAAAGIHPDLARAPDGDFDPRIWNEQADAGISSPDFGGSFFFV